MIARPTAHSHNTTIVVAVIVAAGAGVAAVVNLLGEGVVSVKKMNTYITSASLYKAKHWMHEKLRANDSIFTHASRIAMYLALSLWFFSLR